MNRRARSASLVAALAAGGAVLAGPAQAALSPLPVQDIHTSDRIEDVTASSSPSGDVTVAWTGQNNVPTVLAADKPAGGSFGAVQNLSLTPNATGPSFARGPDGTLLIAYSTATNTVPDEFVVRPPGAAFGAPQPLPLGERFVRVGIDGAGLVTAVWKGFRTPGGLDFVAGSSAAIGSPFGAVEALSPDTDDNFIQPQIAVNPAGDTVVAWSRAAGATEDVLEARIRAGAAFGPAQEILRTPLNSGPVPVVAIAPTGEAVVAWSLEAGGVPVVQAIFRAPGADAFGPVVTLATNATQPRVAMDGDGRALFAWRRVAGDTQVAQAMVRPPGGPPGAAVDISEPSAAGEFIVVSGVGLDASGGAVVSWERRLGTTTLAEAARRPAGGPFEPAVRIADMTDQGRSLAVAVQPSGDAVAAWRETVNATTVLLRGGGLRSLPDAATTATDRCVLSTPTPAAPAAGSGRFALTTSQLAINQRIGQAAVRRLNAISDWLDAGIETRDLCGGTLGPADLAAGIASAPRAVSLAALTPADPRPIVVATPPRGGARFTLTRGQLLINQRIYQAAVRRANALQERLARGLTGGDLADGAVTQGKLHDRLRVTSIVPATVVPASRTEVAAPGRRVPGAVQLTVGQLAVNQRVAQAGVRRANALVARLEAGISSADVRDGTVGAADLSPDALPAP